MDREKVISEFEDFVKSFSKRDDTYYKGLFVSVLSLLKEQEEREKRICKSICEFIRGACSTDTDDDKEFVCYEIQKCFTSEGR